MSRTMFHLKVEMDDGTWEVYADQRDFARFEREPFGVPFHQFMVAPMTALQYFAFSAGRRAKLHAYASFSAFEDHIVFVERLNDDEDEDDSQDPGNPAASAGN